MAFQKLPRLKPNLEDYLRALGYLAILSWVGVFFIFPPNAFVSTLDITTRVLWLGLSALGAILATGGSLLRIDLKLELPGLLLLIIGPMFYWISQMYYSFVPVAAVTDPTQRYALAIYAIIPVILLLPRVAGLLKEINRQKRVNGKK